MTECYSEHLDLRQVSKQHGHGENCARNFIICRYMHHLVWAGYVITKKQNMQCTFSGGDLLGDLRRL